MTGSDSERPPMQRGCIVRRTLDFGDILQVVEFILFGGAFVVLVAIPVVSLVMAIIQLLPIILAVGLFGLLFSGFAMDWRR
jgi:hypothetical protein